MPEAHDVTALLEDVRSGKQESLDRLLPLVYAELRRLAGHALRNERSGHTLQPTALVNEAYVRMIGQDHPDYRNRAHFLAVAARLMRQILIDYARSRRAAKRGGGAVSPSLDDVPEAAVMQDQDVESMLALDLKLKDLAATDERKAKLVELRYFGGLTLEECSDVLGVEMHIVRRDLRLAEAWLRRELA